MVVPTVKLNNGQQMPILGLGTWKSEPNAVKQAVLDAVNAGYRHIDCAYAYQNEHEVGAALEELFAAGTVKRTDLFITSKLWNTFHSKESVPKGIAQTLKDLKLAYVDLYLIHWPHGFQEGGELDPVDANGDLLFSDVDYVETWKAMEKLVKEGKVKSIGVSNFNSKQIQRVLDVAEVKPVVNQVECHPYLTQKDLQQFMNKHNIVLTAYSPLGSPDRAWATKEDPVVLEDATLQAIAKKHGKSPAQVAIRYQTQRGIVVIPKSVTKTRIVENFNIFDFTLTNQEMTAIDALNRNYRALAVPWTSKSKHYPFNIPF